jgi:hypothetical protein
MRSIPPLMVLLSPPQFRRPTEIDFAVVYACYLSEWLVKSEACSVNHGRAGERDSFTATADQRMLSDSS